MNKKRFAALFLSFIMILSALAPAVYASEETKKLEIELEVSDLREDLTTAVGSMEGFEPQNEDEEELVAKFNEAGDFLDGEISLAEDQGMKRVGASPKLTPVGNTIVDVTTIPARIQLLIRISRAIRFGSTELANKVVAAHTKLTEYILVGILHILNPFADEGKIMDYIQGFDALEQELLSYPDLSPNDIATIYKKASLARKLSEARQVRNQANRTGKQFLARQLDAKIKEGSAVWWKIQAICREVDEAIEAIDKAIEKITGPKIRVEKITFEEGDKGAIPVDQKTTVTPVTLPFEAPIKDVTVYSENAYIARVSGGAIIPQKPGNVKIVAISKDTGVKAYFDLYILEPGEYIDGIPMMKSCGYNQVINKPDGGHIGPVGYETDEVNAIEFTLERANFKVGEEFSLENRVMVFPKTAVDKSVTFKSEDESIATVDETGKITGIKEGKTKIVVTATNGVHKEFPVVIEKAEDVSVYKITSVKLSEKRRAGIFDIEIEATKDGEGYTGPVSLVVTSGNRTKNERVYLKNGYGKVRYTGFDFGTWRKEFNGSVTLEDQIELFSKTY